jgi:catechol 2,3-dioxygenase-like lactoylglutathione lyase family enzyme
MFREVHPVLPSRDVAAAIDFYVSKLGFTLIFHDVHPRYAGVRRDGVELHLQWHDPKEWEKVERPMLRFLVADVDALHDEFATQEVFHEQTALRNTTWGTREFAFYDRDQNGLTFYQPQA